MNKPDLSHSLIDELVDDLKPVKPLPSPISRVFSWLIPGLFIVLGGSYFLGWDQVIEHRMGNWSFWLEQSILVFTSIIAAHSAIVFSVPGRDSAGLFRWPFLSLSLWVAFLVFLTIQWILSDGATDPNVHVTAFCPTVLIVMCLPIGFILSKAVVKGAVFKGPLTGLLTTLSAAAMAAFGLQLTCFVGSPIHLIFFHLLPALALTGAGIFLGRKFLQWKQ